MKKPPVDSYTAIVEMGHGAIDNRDFELAVAYFRKARVEKTDNVDDLYALGFALGRVGRDAEAVPVFRRALRLNPNNTAAMAELANAHKELKQTGRARRAFAAFFKESGTPQVLAQYATLRRRMGEHEDAVKLYAAAIVLDPTDVASLNNMALSLTALERYSEAVSACRKGLKLSPGDADLVVNLASAYRQSGRPRLALKSLLTLHRPPANSFCYLLELGNSHADLGNVEDAVDAYRLAAAADTTSASPFMNLGILYDECGRPEDGEIEYRKALEIEPRSADIHNNLGASLEMQARFDEALSEYEMAVAIDPQNELYRQNVAHLEDAKSV